MLSTDTTTVSMLFSVFTTHTTPIIYGVKASGGVDQPPLRDREDVETLKAVDWTIAWSSDGGEAGSVGKVMKAEADVNVIDPSAKVLFALANHQMKLVIQQTGYADAVDGIPEQLTTLRRAIYHSGCIFEGVTTKMTISRTSGGKVIASIHAVDPLMMLERSMLEGNIRFDGISYVMAICNLMRHTEYAPLFEIRFGKVGPGVPGLIIGPSWMDGQRIENYLSGLGLRIPYFGYKPGIGKTYEALPGSLVMNHIKNILQKFDSPWFIPLFYWDPTTHRFVLTSRLRTEFWSPGGSVKRDGRLWIIDAPQGTVTGWDATPISNGLLLQADKGRSLYTLESTTDHMRSHYVAMGSDRITGQPLKATAMNPNWNSLATARNSNEWTTGYGHMGYMSKTVEQEAKQFLPDQRSLIEFVRGRMWWMMRPAMRISDMTVDGLVFPGSGGGGAGLVDGSLGVVIGDEIWTDTLLERSVITYNAEDQRVQSKLSVAIVPSANNITNVT
jgi:hypothetical protein